MAGGRDQTGPGLGLLPAAAGSTGLSGGREHPGDWTVGSALGGEVVGARGGKDDAGRGPRAARRVHARLSSAAARARTLLSGGTSGSDDATSCPALSTRALLGLAGKLFKNVGGLAIRPY